MGHKHRNRHSTIQWWEMMVVRLSSLLVINNVCVWSVKVRGPLAVLSGSLPHSQQGSLVSAVIKAFCLLVCISTCHWVTSQVLWTGGCQLILGCVLAVETWVKPLPCFFNNNAVFCLMLLHDCHCCFPFSFFFFRCNIYTSALFHNSMGVVLCACYCAVVLAVKLLSCKRVSVRESCELRPSHYSTCGRAVAMVTSAIICCFFFPWGVSGPQPHSSKHSFIRVSA